MSGSVSMLNALMSGHAMGNPRQTLISLLLIKFGKKKKKRKRSLLQACVIKIEKKNCTQMSCCPSGSYRCQRSETDSGL